MFTLKFTIEEINAILGSLSKMPWDMANPIIQKIDEQMKPQLNPPATDEEQQ